ncbi:MAG: MOSC N-terminal beta barrel domain-containing protein [Kineosporiaceae bacterium]
MSDVVGTVAQVSVYLVKSLAGRTLEQAEVALHGLAGDRAYVVVDAESGRRLRAKDVPALAEIVPTGDCEADAVTVAGVLGRPVRLERAEEPQVDVAAVHLVSRRALQRAAEGDTPEGCSAEDPRANVVLDLAGDADERTWVGRTVRLGEVLLRVTRTPKHCLGVYAEVDRPGAVRVGDEVHLLDPA